MFALKNRKKERRDRGRVEEVIPQPTEAQITTHHKRPESNYNQQHVRQNKSYHRETALCQESHKCSAATKGPMEKVSNDLSMTTIIQNKGKVAYAVHITAFNTCWTAQFFLNSIQVLVSISSYSVCLDSTIGQSYSFEDLRALLISAQSQKEIVFLRTHFFHFH